MREVVVRLKFTQPCLGNVKRQFQSNGQSWPRYFMPRTPAGEVRFEAVWWRSGMTWAAKVLNRHHAAVKQVHFDVSVDGRTDPERFFKRYLGGDKFVKHEAFFPGDIVGVSLLVPEDISDDDLWKHLDYLGRFRGISPFGREEYGRFTVHAILRK